MSARKPTWTQQLDEREKSIMVCTNASFSDVFERLTQLDEELCRVARAVGESERSVKRALLVLAVALLAVIAVVAALVCEAADRKRTGTIQMITPSASYDLGPTVTQQPGCSQVALDAAQNVFTRRCI